MPAQQTVATSRSIPAPIGGWNARDSIVTMPETDAIYLENLFPDVDKVTARRGFSAYATGFPAQISTLVEWAGPTSNKFFGIANGAIYNISAPGAIGAADVSGLNSSYWQDVMFGTPGGNFLVLVSGSDAVRNYNGTAWSTPAITGVTSADLIHVTRYRNRLFFVEKNSLRAWYLPINSIAGAASSLDFGPLCSRGGYLVAIATWTLDGGEGATDDAIVFITSKGQLLIYRGTDPSTAATWAQVGTFNVAPPIGRRCFLSYGSDLYLVLRAGVFPMTALMRPRGLSPALALSEKIQNAFATSSALYAGLTGWQPIYYPDGKYIAVNVPLSTTKFEQYVMNAITGAWCKFTNQNARCFGMYNDSLYFGTDTVVYKANDTLADAGNNITVRGKTAFTPIALPGRRKKVNMIRPVLESNAGALQLGVAIDADYRDDAIPPTSTTYSSTATLWGSPWGSPWSTDNRIFVEQQMYGNEGFVFASKLKGEFKNITLNWITNDYVFEPGGML